MLPATLLSSFATKIQSKWTGIGRTSFLFGGNRNKICNRRTRMKLNTCPFQFSKMLLQVLQVQKHLQVGISLDDIHWKSPWSKILARSFASKGDAFVLVWLPFCFWMLGNLSEGSERHNQVATWHVSCSSQGNAQPFHKHFDDATSWQLFVEEGTMHFSNFPTFALKLRNCKLHVGRPRGKSMSKVVATPHSNYAQS